MNRKILLIPLMLLATCLVFTIPASETDADDGGIEVLVDKGNGQTYWTTGTGSTLDAILSSACDNLSMSFSASGSEITVDGLTSRTIGGTVCSWKYYEYSDAWAVKTYSGGSSCSATAIAIGFYTEGIVPTVTPAYKEAWTAIHADALNSGSVNNYQPSTETAEVSFTHSSTTSIKPSCYSSPLYENGHVYFTSEDYSKKPSEAYLLKHRVVCYDAESGDKLWEYVSSPNGYEMSTAAIYDDHIYFLKNSGYIYSIPLSGTDVGKIDHSYKTAVTPVPKTSGWIQTGVSSIVYDSGHLFLGTTAGYVLCLNPELELVWSTQVQGAIYPTMSVTVTDGRVYVGDCRGYLTILDETNGNKLAEKLVYFEDSGRVNPPAVIGDYIFASYSDGKGMSAGLWGAIVLKYNPNTQALTVVKDLSDLCVKGTYLVTSPHKTHVFAEVTSDSGSNYLYRIYPTGNIECMFNISEIHGGLTLVDNTYFYATEYNPVSSGNSGTVLVYNMDGEVVKKIDKPDEVDNYTMAATAVVGPYVIACTDAGGIVIEGTMVSGGDEPDPPGPDPPKPDPEEATVKFLIADESEFYFTVEGTGTTVMSAFQDAMTKCGYSDYVVYTGDSTNPVLDSIFGLTTRNVTSTQTQYWISMSWDDDESMWLPAANTMASLYAEDYSEFLVYYGTSDGMSATAPDSLPDPTGMTALVQSDEGTRIMFQSPLGSFFKANATGSTVKEVIEAICTQYSIPCEIDDDTVTIFTLEARDGFSWTSFNGDKNGWTENSQSVSSATVSSSLMAMYFCEEGDSPTVPTSSIVDFPVSSDILGAVLKYLAIAIAVILLILVAAYLIRIKKTQPMGVMAYLRMTLKRHNPSGSKIKYNKLKLLVVCLIGLVATFIMFLCSLAIGPSMSLSLGDALSALISAIGKDSSELSFNEIIVYQSRLPRAIAALAVGIGLSVAGCVYQAIIRNPLVDPYIMGVSSGAGTFAVAAIAANFTFFGLLSANTFSTPILAVVGGLLAFSMTMIIAEKAGGSSTNYVLAGVVIGLVFSSIQTMLLVTSTSEKLTSAISWLFGSFANVGWDTVWIIFFPAIFLSIVPLVWAKELNLVLLGEDQAKQMGLNVRKFNRWMLILASVLTSVCVAFVGIIGFVGMVIPHLSRMLLGGDHRLVLPASIMMGGALMLFADLMAKMLMIPTELPVGAITTIIGVPVFAYLLIKKGRMYSG